jgi:uncharacterized protein YjbJ (UPF0337 family)
LQRRRRERRVPLCGMDLASQYMRPATGSRRYLAGFSFLQEIVMNKDIAAGKWKQLKGEVKRKWGMLTDDEIDQIDGNAEKLTGLLQERYGKSRDEAEREVRDWRRKNEVMEA